MWSCDGNPYTASNNTATYIYTNAAGCDSTVTLDLTINNSTTSTDTYVACEPYTWLDGVTYTTSNSTATFTSTNAAGCTNVATLDLTISAALASISQSGDSLFAVTTPIGLNADWYNIQTISYHWTEDDKTRIWLMEENTPSFSPTFDCSYFTVVEDENGCVDTSETYYFGATAKRIGSLTTSPNPTRGLIKVTFENSKNQFVELELVNSKGVKLDEFVSSGTEMNIDISKYPSGTYYIHFNSKDNVQGCIEQEAQIITNKIILNK
jgi:hypothetical protein